MSFVLGHLPTWFGTGHVIGEVSLAAAHTKHRGEAAHRQSQSIQEKTPLKSAQNVRKQLRKS